VGRRKKGNHGKDTGKRRGLARHKETKNWGGKGSIALPHQYEVLAKAAKEEEERQQEKVSYNLSSFSSARGEKLDREAEEALIHTGKKGVSINEGEKQSAKKLPCGSTEGKKKIRQDTTRGRHKRRTP